MVTKAAGSIGVLKMSGQLFLGSRKSARSAWRAGLVDAYGDLRNISSCIGVCKLHVNLLALEKRGISGLPPFSLSVHYRYLVRSIDQM